MSFDLNGINASAYNDYMQQQTQNAVGDKLKQTLTDAAEKARKAGGAEKDEEINQELMGACQQFEAYFLEQVFKEMQKSVEAMKADESGSNKQLVDFFKDKTLQDLTQKSTETQGLGFAQMLYENMKHTVGMSTSQIAESNAAIVAAAQEKSAAVTGDEQSGGEDADVRIREAGEAGNTKE